VNQNQLARTIDHTNLKAEATHEDIQKLCEEGAHYGFYSVCVNPYYVAAAQGFLKNLGASCVSICTVIGFPLGMNLSNVKARETVQALKDGATEFDMVLNIGQLRERNCEYVRDDIKAVLSEIQPNQILKVIIETGLLNDAQKVDAAKLVLDSGAHFVKTSTGTLKDSAGATLGATIADIKLLRQSVGTQISIKASGGISSTEQALAMIEAGADRLGTSQSTSIISRLPFRQLKTQSCCFI